MSRSVHDQISERKTADADIDPAELGHIRASTKVYFANGGSLDDLDIERSAPPRGMKFAFIQPTPRILTTSRPVDRSLWRRCSYCERDRQYIDGRMVLCTDHRIRLIGPDCWHDHVNQQDWHAADVEFKRYERIEQFKTLQGVIFPLSKVLQGEIKTARALARESADFADELWGVIAATFPALAEELERAHRHDDQLYVERLRVDYARLEGSRGRAEADRSDNQVPRIHVPEVVHRLAGSALIGARPNIAKGGLDRAFQAINAATHQINADWHGMTDAQFDKAATEFEGDCRDAIEAVTDAIALMQAAALFMGSSNLRGIARWANDEELILSLDGLYEAIASGLAFTPQRGDRVECRLPRGYQIPTVDHLEEMRRLLFTRVGGGKRRVE